MGLCSPWRVIKRKIVEENPRLEGPHGEALRLLLDICERGEAILLLGAE
jgi:ATP-dependent DNA helicase RecG